MCGPQHGPKMLIRKKKYPNENNSTDNLKKKLNIIYNSTFSSSLNEVLELPKILDILSSKIKWNPN